MTHFRSGSRVCSKTESVRTLNRFRHDPHQNVMGRLLALASSSVAHRGQ